MEETEGAESRSLREASTQANNGEDDLDMTGLMSAATLGGQGRVVLEGLEEAPEEDDELEDSVMTATNTPTPAGSLQPN